MTNHYNSGLYLKPFLTERKDLVYDQILLIDFNL